MLYHLLSWQKAGDLILFRFTLRSGVASYFSAPSVCRQKSTKMDVQKIYIDIIHFKYKLLLIATFA